VCSASPLFKIGSFFCYLYKTGNSVSARFKVYVVIFGNSVFDRRGHFKQATISPGILPKLVGFHLPEKVQIVPSLILPSHQKVNLTLIASISFIQTQIGLLFAQLESGRRALQSGVKLIAFPPL